MQDEPVSTAAIADACLFEKVAFGVAPSSILPLQSTVRRLNGPALTVVHHGSVDAFLEALYRATPGAMLVADNGGRDDEACLGDLVALEASAAGVAGIVIWGRHRDTSTLERLPLSVWSRGASPKGPAGVRPAERAAVVVGDVTVEDGDLVAADEDGIVFVAGREAEHVIEVAREIERVEREQAERARAGVPLREQFRFDEYLERRAAEPSLTFRQHLREISAEIER